MNRLLFLFLLNIVSSLQSGPTYYIVPLVSQKTVNEDVLNLTTVLKNVAGGTKVVMERATMSYLFPNYKSLTQCMIGSSGSCKTGHIPSESMCLQQGVYFRILDSLLKILQDTPSSDVKRSELIFFISVSCMDVKKDTYPDLLDMFNTRWDSFFDQLNRLQLHTYIFWNRLSSSGTCKRVANYDDNSYIYVSFTNWDGEQFEMDVKRKFAEEWNITRSNGKSRTKDGEFNYTIAFVVTGAVLVLLMIAILMFVYRKQMRLKQVMKFVETHQTSAKRYRIQEDDGYEVEHEDFKFTYDVILGCGVSGKVYKGILNKYDSDSKEFSKVDVAIKICHVFAKTEMKKDMIQEIGVMKTLNHHPNVLRLVACVSDVINPIIATEYCRHGDLLQMLREHPRHYMSCKKCDNMETCLSLPDIYLIGAQVADGMAYMAKRNYVHRDLASRNVLMTHQNVPKIGDFGLCISYSVKPSSRDAIKLPIRSLSIESITEFIFCERTDVWAYGVMFFEILTGGEKPYAGIDNTKLLQYLQSGKRLKLPEDAPKEICNLVYQCWETNSHDRPSFLVIRKRMEEFFGNTTPNIGNKLAK